MTNDEYLQRLNNERWQIIPYTKNKGVEINYDHFLVLPLATKVLHIDNNNAVMNRVIVKDYNEPVEIVDGLLDYVFIHEIGQTVDSNKWLSKLKDDGYLITFQNGEWKIVRKAWNNGEYILPIIPDIIPTKNVGVCRLGAYGDLLQATSVIHALKKEGYHVTVYAQSPHHEVLLNNPNIDKLEITDREQVRNIELRQYWDYLEKKHSKFVNLNGSVEDVLLPNSTRPQFYWPIKLRNKYLNNNYVAFSHELADVKYSTSKLNIKFYPSKAELKWAAQERTKYNGKDIICYVLSGSSLHKTWPYLDALIARIMISFPFAEVVLLGGDREAILQSGWENEPRVHSMASKWSIRESLTFVQQNCTLLISPESGIINGMCVEPIEKILFLSHSSKTNLCRDWINTTVFKPDYEKLSCKGNCCPHRLHMNEEGFKYIAKDAETGVSVCQSSITIDDVWRTVFLKIRDKK